MTRPVDPPEIIELPPPIIDVEEDFKARRERQIRKNKRERALARELQRQTPEDAQGTKKKRSKSTKRSKNKNSKRSKRSKKGKKGKRSKKDKKGKK